MKTQTAPNAAAPAEFLKNLPLPTLDLEALVATQKRNLDAAVEAHRVATEGIKAIAARQEEIVKGAVGELQNLGRELKTPEKYVELATAMARKSFDQVREVAELAAKANKDVLEVVIKRSNDSLNELKAAVKVAQA